MNTATDPSKLDALPADDAAAVSALLLQHAGLAVCVLTEDGAVRFANPAACDALGLPAGSLRGRSVADCLPASEVPACLAAIAAALREDTARTHEAWATRRGETRRYTITLVPVPANHAAPRTVLVLSRDSTPTHEQETSLERVLYRHHAIMTVLPDAVLECTPDGIIRDVNPAAAAIAACSPDQMIGANVASMIDPLDLQHHPLRFDLVLGGRQVARRRRILRRDGSSRTIDTVASRTPEGNVLVVGRDITDTVQAESQLDHAHHALLERARRLQDINARLQEEIDMRQRVERALRESEQTFRAVAERSTDGILIAGASGQIHFVSSSLASMTGRAAAELQHEDASQLLPALSTLMTERPPARADLSQADGQTIPVEVVVTPINWHGLPASLAVVHDLRERLRRAEDVAATRRSLRRLAAHLQLARENERAAIGREMHDELGQLLTAVKLDLFWISRHLTDAQAATERLAGVVELVDRSIQSVKRLCADLRPPLLEDEGLAAALEWHCTELRRHSDLRIHLEVHDARGLPPALAKTAFRVVQEALTNVTRHAEARDCWVTVRRRHGHRDLPIRDNGKGMDPSVHVSPDSFGLVGMRERVETAGGTLSINGAPGRGTALHAALPLDTPLPRGYRTPHEAKE